MSPKEAEDFNVDRWERSWLGAFFPNSHLDLLLGQTLLTLEEDSSRHKW